MTETIVVHGAMKYSVKIVLTAKRRNYIVKKTLTKENTLGEVIEMFVLR